MGADLPHDIQEYVPQSFFWYTTLGQTSQGSPPRAAVVTDGRVLATRDLVDGAKTDWDIMPEMQVTLRGASMSAPMLECVRLSPIRPTVHPRSTSTCCGIGPKAISGTDGDGDASVCSSNSRCIAAVSCGDSGLRGMQRVKRSIPSRSAQRLPYCRLVAWPATTA